jgi:predicted RNA polymerase sigma factor
VPSPVVDLNRAVAYSMAEGPDVGLELLAALEAEPALAGFMPVHAAKGDFLFRAGRLTEAAAEFARAAELSRNEQEKAFLLQRLRQTNSMSDNS